MNSVDFPAESEAIGKLSLSSFVKLTLIAAIGVTPVYVLLGLVGLGIHFVRSGDSQDSLPSSIAWSVFLFKLGAAVILTPIEGAFIGVAGYPFYSWLCRVRGGVILKGRFWGR